MVGMTLDHPAIAYEPGVCPEPPARQVGLLQWMRLVYKNPIAVFDREMFAADFRQKQVFLGNFVLVNEPDFIEHILLTNHRNYSKGRIIRDTLGPVLGDGLVTSEGALWRRQRRIAAPGFHQQRLAQAAGAMSRLARQRVERWRAPCEKGEPLDVAEEMSSLTMEIVARTLFSMDMSKSIADIGRAMTTVIAAFGTLNPLDFLGWPAWIPRPRSRRTRAALARLELAIQGIIAQRRRVGEAPDDFLSLLMAGRDEETGEGMSDKQLRDEVVTFFTAGHETTAMALTWTLCLLSRHPAVERELHEEVDRVLGARAAGDGPVAAGPAVDDAATGEAEATIADLESLPYTRMVIEEAMRLFPPVFSMQREPLEDDEVGGHRIPAGSFVTISPYVTHRNPILWPDPLRFDPLRFTSDRTKERHAFAYIPFGGGPRACIGSGFAMMEACLVLAHIARAYRLRVVPGHPVEAQGWITLRPRYGLRMTLEKRVSGAVSGL